MVVDLEPARVDLLFHALADATRRDIVRRTMDGSFSVSTLARAYPMRFAAVPTHVAVREGGGLVATARRGRERLVAADAAALRAARDVLDRLELLWRERVARMDDLLAADPDSGKES